MDFRKIGTGNVPIVPEKLELELAKRGINKAYASTEIGRANNYIATCLNAGNINKQSMILLEKMYDIKPESYMVEVENGGAQLHTEPAENKEEMGAIRAVLFQTLAEIKELNYTMRIIEQDIAELKSVWTESEVEQ